MVETSPRRRVWPYWLTAAVGVMAGIVVIAASWWRPAAPAITPAATVAARAPVSIAAGPWEQVALPVPAADVSSFAVAPDDADTLYVCTVYVTGIVWRTTDAGAHWSRHDLPHARGTACQISVAGDNPARIGLRMTTQAQQGQPCANTTFYLSDDRGLTWRELPTPASPAPANSTPVWCGLQVTGRHLFMLYSFDTGAGAHQTTLLERSDDDGADWTPVGGALTSDSLFTSLLVGPNDMMATLAAHIGSAQREYGTDLLVSSDGGRTWQTRGQAPESVGTFLLGAPPRGRAQWPSPSRPFYGLSSEQISSDLYREGVFATADGRGWQQLPSLPVPGLSADQHGILQVLAALPDGRLAAWGADPRAGVRMPRPVPDLMTSFWLWLWDPGAHRWQVLPTPLAATMDEGCGLCWSAQAAMDRSGATYLYVTAFALTQGNTTPGPFRIRLPRAN